MNSLDLNLLQGSILEMLEKLPEELVIIELEAEFYVQWRALGRFLFEKLAQKRIDIYENEQKGAKQSWSKKYHTRLGSIRLLRKSYPKEGRSACLADQACHLPEKGWFPTLEKLATVFGLELDFANAANMLEETTGVQLSGHSLANHVEEIGMEMEEIQSKEEPAETYPMDSALAKNLCKSVPKPYVYVGKDGVLVPLNQKQGYKEALVGVVFRESAHMSISPMRNEVRHPHYVATLDAKDHFCEQLFKSFSYLVGSEPCQPVILGDGAHWIWEQASLHYPEAIQILDFYHLSEYVWAVAHEELSQNEEQQKTWVEQQLTALKESRVTDVLTGLDIFDHKRKATAKDAISRLRTYVQNNLQRIDYARYLKLGLMIGSGVVESSNRKVVSQRLKQSGMHWSWKGAKSIMTLRATYLSSGSQWSKFWRQAKSA